MRGFSLVEIMVALGLSCVVLLTISNLTNLSMRSSQYLSEKSDFISLLSTLQSTIMNPMQCSANLRRLRFDTTSSTLTYPIPYTRTQYDQMRSDPDHFPFKLASLGLFHEISNLPPDAILFGSGTLGKLTNIKLLVIPQSFVDTGQDTVFTLLYLSAEKIQSGMGSQVFKNEIPVAVNLIVEKVAPDSNQILGCLAP